MNTTELTVKKIAALTWAVLVDGVEKGIISGYQTRRGMFYCHERWIGRGCYFTSINEAAADLAKRAA